MRNLSRFRLSQRPQNGQVQMQVRCNLGADESNFDWSKESEMTIERMLTGKMPVRASLASVLVVPLQAASPPLTPGLDDVEVEFTNSCPKLWCATKLRPGGAPNLAPALHDVLDARKPTAISFDDLAHLNFSPDLRRHGTAPTVIR